MEFGQIFRVLEVVITQALVLICTRPRALHALEHRAYIPGKALLPVL